MGIRLSNAGNFLARLLLVPSLGLALTVGALAQAPDGHSEHHPAGPSAPAPSNQSTPLGTPPASGNVQQPTPGPAGAMNNMGEMMGEMMGRPRKEFYPSLMSVPTLTPEQRQSLEAQARARINTGMDELAKAEAALRHAMAAGDSSGADRSAQTLRQSLDQVSSGTATLRALAEGKPPQQIAQAWFKTQLSLPAVAVVESKEGPLGLSWYHWTIMALVTIFAVGMLAIYFLRVRRANALVGRLSNAAAKTIAPAATSPIVGPSQSSGSAKASNEAIAAPPLGAPIQGVQQKQQQLDVQAPPGIATTSGLWKGRLRVAAIFPETPNVKTFRLRDPQGGRLPFSFLPGQFLTYSAEIDGKLVRRSYTIASSPSQSVYVETTIKREDFGVFSDYMHDKIKVGDLLDVTAPSGVFTFEGSEAESVVLIGGGVGITPLMAAIRYLTDTTWPGDIYLVYGARTSADFIFRDELEYLQRHHANLHMAATMTRAAGTSWVGPEGPITKEFLAQVVPNIAQRRVHLCGPPGMMAAMRKCLADLGVPDAQIKTEAFGPARGAVPPPGVTLVAPIPSSAGRVGEMAPGTTTTEKAAIGPATASIRFARSNKTVPLPPDKTVLEIAESAGVPIDYACRVGVCGTCKTKLLEGKVTMEVEDALTPEDKADNIILACQAKSIGNLVVEA
ncbi:MAG: 2Fe-2S iron-sulfur cluster binding domain-containing protein [Xanthobacteraceae bacterium]|nr:2Fe-2S iron-sulfur cluster binding domain-containing protein [Xanthobacteraceae bacterium]